MDDAPDVGVGHRQAHLLEDAEEPRPVLGRARALLQQFSQGAALDQLHGEIRPAIGEGAQLIDRDHAGVLQLAGDLGLLDEPADQVGVLAMLLEQDLDGQVAAEVAVAPLDDDAHPAAGDLAEEVEPSQAVQSVGHPGRRGADHRPGVAERLIVAQVHPRDVRKGPGQPCQRGPARMSSPATAETSPTAIVSGASCLCRSRSASAGGRRSIRPAAGRPGTTPRAHRRAAARRILGSDPDPPSSNLRAMLKGGPRCLFPTLANRPAEVTPARAESSRPTAADVVPIDRGVVGPSAQALGRSQARRGLACFQLLASRPRLSVLPGCP